MLKWRFVEFDPAFYDVALRREADVGSAVQDVRSSSRAAEVDMLSKLGEKGESER